MFNMILRCEITQKIWITQIFRTGNENEIHFAIESCAHLRNCTARNLNW